MSTGTVKWFDAGKGAVKICSCTTLKFRLMVMQRSMTVSK